MKNVGRIVVMMVIVVLLSMTLFGCGNKELTISEQIEEAYAVENDGLICAMKGDKWGYIDAKGKTKIEFDYAYAEPFSDGTAVVKKDGKYGMINKKGKAEIDYVFDDLYVTDAAIVGVLGEKEYVIDDKGKKLSNGYDSIYDFGDDEHAVAVNYATDDKKASFYVINTKGKELITLSSEAVSATVLSNGVVRVKNSDAKYAIYSVKGKKILDYKYLYLDSCDDEGLYVAANLDGKYGVINEKDKVKIEFKYSGVQYIAQSGQFLVRGDGLRFGIVDEKGKEVIETKYYRICDMGDKVYFASELVGDSVASVPEINGILFSYGGKKLATFSDTTVPSMFVNGYTVMMNEEYKSGLINTKGKQVLECVYDGLSYVLDGLICFRKGNKYGFINVKGKEIIPAEYSRKMYMVDGLAAAAKGGYVGVINAKGKVVVPFEYDAIKLGSGGTYDAPFEEISLTLPTGNYYYAYENDDSYPVKAELYKLGDNVGYVEASGTSKNISLFEKDSNGYIEYSRSIYYNSDGVTVSYDSGWEKAEDYVQTYSSNGYVNVTTYEQLLDAEMYELYHMLNAYVDDYNGRGRPSEFIEGTGATIAGRTCKMYSFEDDYTDIDYYVTDGNLCLKTVDRSDSTVCTSEIVAIGNLASFPDIFDNYNE